MHVVSAKLFFIKCEVFDSELLENLDNKCDFRKYQIISSHCAISVNIINYDMREVKINISVFHQC